MSARAKEINICQGVWWWSQRWRKGNYLCDNDNGSVIRRGEMKLGQRLIDLILMGEHILKGSIIFE